MAHLRRSDRKNALFFWIIIILILGVGAFLLGSGVFAAFFPYLGGLGSTRSSISGGSSGDEQVLLLGIDALPTEVSARSDTMIVANISPGTDQISLFSIPRDTRVNIPGKGMGKINACNAYGGPTLALTCVNNLLGTHIRAYVVANFQGFTSVINTLGGVYINVPFAMYHLGDTTDTGLTSINLAKGYQHLNGVQALGFVRWRDGTTGDIGRTARQQEFLKAVAQQIFQFGTVLRLPQLLPELQKAIHSNLSVTQMASLAMEFQGSGKLKILADTAPGYYVTINDASAAIYGSSYWLVIPADVQKAFQQLLLGKTVNIYDSQAANLALEVGTPQTPTQPTTLPLVTPGASGSPGTSTSLGTGSGSMPTSGPGASSPGSGLAPNGPTGALPPPGGTGVITQ